MKIAEKLCEKEAKMSNLFISRWQVDPAKREQFLAVFDALYEGAKPLLAEHSSAFHYGWGRDANEFIAIEAWKDDSVVAALRQSPQFHEAFAAMMACSAATMKMEIVNDLANNREIFGAHPTGKSTVHPDIGFGTVYL